MNTFLHLSTDQKMASDPLTSKEISSRDSSSTRERKRLLLLQKRLDLQQERIDVDRAILEAEKASFEKSVQLAGADNEDVDTDTIAKLEQNIKELREERDMLAVQVRNQSRQIDDWKLLLPRNKALLDQAISKNHQLVKELETEKRKQAETWNPTKLQRKRSTQTNNEHDDIEEASMDDLNTVCLEYTYSQQQQDLSKMATIPYSTIVKSILIPSDLSSEDLDRCDKKFVIESEWANKESGLAGMYTGWLDLEGNPSGCGTLRIYDGGIYIGEWNGGLRNGHGVYTSIDGAIYSGPWQNDRFEGRGILVSETNQVYTGDWKNGLRHGSGIETWVDGDCYSGNYHLDKRDGAFSCLKVATSVKFSIVFWLCSHS